MSDFALRSFIRMCVSESRVSKLDRRERTKDELSQLSQEMSIDTKLCLGTLIK